MMPLDDTELHALKTPLTAVIGYAESLQHGDYGSINPDQVEALSVIINRSRELLSLLGQMKEETCLD